MTSARDDLAALFALPPERFVAARNALVAELRARGDARVAEVRALRRPSPSAWVVNALVRSSPSSIERVRAAGDALLAAQGRVLGGADRSELHEATRAAREAIQRALREAKAILAQHGRRPTPDLIRKVTATLRAVSLDRRIAAEVARGMLTTDPQLDEGEVLERAADAPRGKPARPALRVIEGGRAEKAGAKTEAARDDGGRRARAPQRRADARTSVPEAVDKPRAAEARLAEKARAEKARAEKARAEKARLVEKARLAEAKRLREEQEARERLAREVADAEAEVDEARRAVARAESERRRARAAADDAERALAAARSALKTSEDRRRRASRRAGRRGA